MFLRRRVLFAAQRLPVAHTRSIVPLLRYSTEAAAVKDADSPGATDQAGETQLNQGDVAKSAKAAAKKTGVWDSPHPVVKTGTFAASRVSKTRLAPVKPVSAKPAPATPAPATPAPETPAPETPAPETPAPETPASETPAPEAPAPETPVLETPAKSEPEKPEPAKPEPAKPEPAKPKPAKSAPAKSAPAKPAPAKPKPAKHVPVTPSPAKAAANKTNSPPTPAPDSVSPNAKKGASAQPAAPGPENPYTPAPVAEETLSGERSEYDPPRRSETPTKNLVWDFKQEDAAMDVNWEKSWYGIGTKPVTLSQNKVLSRPINMGDIEVKPDGIIYLPEIKYRRRLNEAFGPMGWGMVHRGEAVVGANIVTREYALVIGGRMVAQAQGVNNYFSNDGLPHAIEGCKSNALMRCCKDLGIASELWDPVFLRWFRKHYMEERWVENVSTKKKRTFWFKKGLAEAAYPYKLI